MYRNTQHAHGMHTPRIQIRAWLLSCSKGILHKAVRIVVWYRTMLGTVAKEQNAQSVQKAFINGNGIASECIYITFNTLKCY